MNLINLPPWLQTICTGLGFLAVFLPGVVHLSGKQDTPAGKVITDVGSNIVGLFKRLNAESETK